MYNSHVIINDLGDISEIYRKIHLFDVVLPDQNVRLKESDSTTAGSRVVVPLATPAGLLGLSVVSFLSLLSQICSELNP